MRASVGPGLTTKDRAAGATAASSDGTARTIENGQALALSVRTEWAGGDGPKASYVGSLPPCSRFVEKRRERFLRSGGRYANDCAGHFVVRDGRIAEFHESSIPSCSSGPSADSSARRPTSNPDCPTCYLSHNAGTDDSRDRCGRSAMVLLLSLCAAVAYGLSDFVGGVATRRASVWPVAATSQGTAAVLTVGLAATNLGDPEFGDLSWGALAGVGSGAGNVFIYRGLARGRMAVVAPLSAIAAAALPVLVGLSTGERPGILRTRPDPRACGPHPACGQPSCIGDGHRHRGRGDIDSMDTP
jgi:uncharacterized membrane protein